MRTIMSRSVHENSFSFSRRYLNWGKKCEDRLTVEETDEVTLTIDQDSSSHDSFSSFPPEEEGKKVEEIDLKSCVIVPKSKKLSVSKFKSFFTKGKVGNMSSSSNSNSTTLGSKVVGTVFGYRRGHVHICFQGNSKNAPAFLIELSTPTSVLVKEMASGLVRVALECDKKLDKKGVKLLEEPLWRAYCNGKKCGYAIRRECGPDEWRVLRAVGPITMGAGVLPDCDGGGGGDGDGDGGDLIPSRVKAEGELMYMRAKFERIVGSKDSEAFYMMNPDGNGNGNGNGNAGPELSVYLLRV